MSVIVPGQFIFLANPRTASQAVTQYLIDNYPTAIHTVRRHHATLMEIETFPKKMLGCDNYKRQGEYVFTTIRNHWDALASWFELSHFKKMDLFLDKYEHTYFAKKECLWFLHNCDVIKYENLESSLSQMLCRVVKLPNIGWTVDKKPYMSYYNDYTFNKVLSNYGKEIKQYGY